MIHGADLNKLMQIRIDDEHKTGIEHRLRQDNSPSAIYAFTQYSDIKSLALAAEAKLDALLVPVKKRAGAQCCALSGKPASSRPANRKSRKGTHVRLVRGAAGWYLESVVPYNLGADEGGELILLLSTEQDEIVVSKFRENNYGVHRNF